MNLLSQRESLQVLFGNCNKLFPRIFLLNPNPSGPLIDMIKVLLNMAFIFRRYSNLKFKLICLFPVKVCSPRTFLSAFVIDTAELDSAMSKRMQSLTPWCHDITEMYVQYTIFFTFNNHGKISSKLNTKMSYNSLVQ